VDPAELHSRRHDHDRQQPPRRRPRRAPDDQGFGGGELASADGIRFVVPVRSVRAGANPKYFGRGKGVTYINYTSAGSIGFFGFVVPGTLRDSMVILDGLLEQHTSLRPTTLVTDSSYSDIVFGLCM